MRRTARALVVGVVGVLWCVVPAQAANDTGWDNQWNMRIVGAEAAWSVGTGNGITIAVVDTGVHLAQEDLTGKLLSGRDFVDPDTSPQDDNGHGTHVAGIAAAYANNGRGVVGVAPEARILPVKVLDRNGRGAADIDEGIRWAVDNGAHVVNLSIGNLLEPISGPPFTEAIRYAWSRGVVCVIATGNEFVTSSTFENEPAILVTATDREDRKPQYATRVGEARWGMAAPGGAGSLDEPQENDVFSTYWTSSNAANQYAWLSGTSMAAPHVAGAVAVLRSLGLSPQEAVDRLLATAEDLGAAGVDTTYGHGRLDLAKAVAGLAPAGEGNTKVGPGVVNNDTDGGGGAGGGTGSADGAPAGPTAGSGSGTSNRTRGRTTGTVSVSTTSSVPASVPTTDDGEDGEAAADRRRAPTGSGPDGDDTVWPLAVLASAALGATGWAAVRVRRRRV